MLRTSGLALIECVVAVSTRMLISAARFRSHLSGHKGESEIGLGGERGEVKVSDEEDTVFTPALLDLRR